MEAYANILLYAIPVFLILIFIEHIGSLVKGIKINRLFDVISSLSSGITNIIKDILGLSIVIISYGFMVDHWAIFNMPESPWLYVVAFIGIDFAGYWTHRFSHEINIFWNRHIIHHSSEEFNLSCALRQSVSEIFALFTILYLPLALLGVPKEIIAVVAPLHLFAQFWYHTRLIDKMGWLEYVIVTPSHHRVHHAINPEYMDKNYGQIFIVWDKWFGTFQEESMEIQPVYGVTRAVKTWNPWIINYKHMALLIMDFFRTHSWKDKARIWFMPTGWRPDDVAQKYPVAYTKNVFERTKYDTKATSFFQVWVTIQLLVTLLFTLHFFGFFGQWTHSEIFLYGTFIFIQIFAYTSLMDGNLLGLIGEIVKLVFVSVFVFKNGFWFGMSQQIPVLNSIVMLYFGISLILSFYFYFFEKPSANVEPYTSA